VFAWYVKNYGPEVNLFVDHSQIVQLECLRSGVWGTKSLWGRVLTYKGGGTESGKKTAAGRDRLWKLNSQCGDQGHAGRGGRLCPTTRPRASLPPKALGGKLARGYNRLWSKCLRQRRGRVCHFATASARRAPTPA